MSIGSHVLAESLFTPSWNVFCYAQHPATFILLNNLAASFDGQGRLEKAISCLEQALGGSLNKDGRAECDFMEISTFPESSATRDPPNLQIRQSAPYRVDLSVTARRFFWGEVRLHTFRLQKQSSISPTETTFTPSLPARLASLFPSTQCSHSHHV